MSVSPPRLKGPPLNALRAFEAAARYESFTAAAEELCVTPGAVAQQVKILENWMGVSLFERHAQGVSLTQLGSNALDEFAVAFDRLGEAVQKLRALSAPQDVRIAALPSIAQLCLSPLLPTVRAAFPSLNVSITAMESRPNLQRELFDLCLYYECVPESSGLIPISQDVIFPVCSPDMSNQIKNIGDLNKVTCLHDLTWSSDWAQWLSSLDEDVNVETSGPVFSLYSLALEEARNGAGVLMGHTALVANDLVAGKLVAPFRSKFLLDQWLSIGTASRSDENPAVAGIVEALKQNYGR